LPKKFFFNFLDLKKKKLKKMKKENEKRGNSSATEVPRKGDQLGYLVPAIVDLIYNLFCFM